MVTRPPVVGWFVPTERTLVDGGVGTDYVTSMQVWRWAHETFGRGVGADTIVENLIHTLVADDEGTGFEFMPELAVRLRQQPVYDLGHGFESQFIIRPRFGVGGYYVGDNATGFDLVYSTNVKPRSTPIYDLGHGFDGLTVPHVYIPALADYGHGFDTAEVKQAEDYAGVPRINVGVPFDTGHGFEAPQRRVHVWTADLGHGFDLVYSTNARLRQSAPYELGHGFETPVVPRVDIGRPADDGHGFEWSTLNRATTATSVDRGAGTEAFAPRAHAWMADDGHGFEALPVAQVRPRLPAPDGGHGYDVGIAPRKELYPAEGGIGSDTCAAGFTYQAPQLVLVTTVQTMGSMPIPAWARYIDAVALGGGAGGQNGSWIGAGNGGNPGKYGAARFDRGVSRDTRLAVSSTVGNGGARQSEGQDSWVGVSQPPPDGTVNEICRGTRGNGYGGSRDAAGPGNYSYNGISAVGGSGNGNPPGSGGRGGPGGTNGNSASDAARGQVWIQFSM